ncbi:trypsin [Bemisia tabaci]
MGADRGGLFQKLGHGVTLISLVLDYANNSTQTSVVTEEGEPGVQPSVSVSPLENVDVNVVDGSPPTAAALEEIPNELETAPAPDSSSCNCVCGVINRRMRIVGGNVTRVNEFPWIAALSRRGKFYCGGTLITNRHILTAAHCIEGIQAKEIKVTLGEHDRQIVNETETVVRKVKKTYRHPEFQISNFNNDIAVLELESTVDIAGPHVRTACLPAEDGVNYTGRTAVVAGWGRVDERKPISRVLRKVEVPIISETDCKSAGYSESRITDNMICAGYKEGKRDSCQGDSGGPMQINGTRAGNMEVIGIVSWGRGCARPNYPGVYTRIANYLDWIQEQLGIDKFCCSAPVQKLPIFARY